jgi:integrase
LSDGGGGLYLKVYPSGTKTFLLRPRHGGRQRKIALGRWPHLSLADARLHASARKAGALHATIEGKAATSASIVQEWYDTVIAPRYKRTANARVYADHLKTELAGTPLRRVSRAQVAQVVARYRRRGQVAANRLMEATKRFFAWAVKVGYIDVSPAAALDRSVAGGDERSRDRVLTDTEIVAMWYREHRTTPLLRFLLLTGCRIGEAQAARVQHVDGTTLIIPPEHSKNGKAHQIRLTPLARACIEARAAPFLFRGRTQSSVQHSLSRWQNERSDAWTPHDLRRTFASGLARLGAPPHVIAACLNHTLEGTLPVYVRGDQQFWDERTAALEKWSRHILALTNEQIGMARAA